MKLQSGTSSPKKVAGRIFQISFQNSNRFFFFAVPMILNEHVPILLTQPESIRLPSSYFILDVVFLRFMPSL